ncbi:MAG TPA: glycosyltransferase family 2 protein [Sphingomonas sp.]|nr:glycosyltransferase family 2 protein [Sphingomonas sp.]
MRLSIVLPVYDVAPFLAQCLASICYQDFQDFEIVAVDDASTDGCGAILADWAARDARVKIVSLPHNRGLGGARNAGLERARGDLVWFLDSDDWLEPGALRAAVKQADRLESDVLIVGWTRVYPDGRRIRGGGQELLAAAPETFTLTQWPDVLGILHVAWNKLVKRDLLVKSAIAFEPGWYEDVPFTYPLLIAARRIATLDRACVAYRQRGTGAITTTTSDRHFEVLAQWDRAMAVSRPEIAEPSVERALFVRMLWHLIEILNKGSRVPERSKRRFFAEIHRRYRRYRPTGFRPARSFDGTVQRLIAANAFWGFQQLYRARRLIRRVTKRWRGGPGERHSTATRRMPDRQAARR